jgi:hypothetical protein
MFWPNCPLTSVPLITGVPSALSSDTTLSGLPSVNRSQSAVLSSSSISLRSIFCVLRQEADGWVHSTAKATGCPTGASRVAGASKTLSPLKADETVKNSDCELPPPGVGLVTTIERLPALAISEA